MKKMFNILIYILVFVMPVVLSIVLITRWDNLGSFSKFIMVDTVVVCLIAIVNIIYDYFWLRSMNKLFKELQNSTKENNNV